MVNPASGMASGMAHGLVYRASAVVWGNSQSESGVAHAPGHRVMRSMGISWSNHIPLSPSLGSRPPLGEQFQPPTGPTGRENLAKGSGRAAVMNMNGPWIANPARALVRVPPPASLARWPILPATPNTRYAVPPHVVCTISRTTPDAVSVIRRATTHAPRNNGGRNEYELPMFHQFHKNRSAHVAMDTNTVNIQIPP